jgi:hypothetical protein
MKDCLKPVQEGPRISAYVRQDKPDGGVHPTLSLAARKVTRAIDSEKLWSCALSTFQAQKNRPKAVSLLC